MHTAINDYQPQGQIMSINDYVNPFQGTDSHFAFSQGNTLPLITRPFGMTSWSLQTDEGPWVFQWSARKLQGIRATHQPSPWIGDYGHCTILPMSGIPAISAFARASIYDRAATVARPHYLRTYLGRYRTWLELTPTERCAMLRCTFPADATGHVLLQLFDAPGHVQILPEQRRVVGYTRAKSGGAPDNFACYLVAEFDRPFVAAQISDGNTVVPEATERTGRQLGALLSFDTAADPVLTFRVATSFISVEQALRNLEHEIGAKPFDTLRAEAEAAWEATLGKIQIEGASERQLQTFYTCLYRAHIFPRIWHEPDASGQPIHYSPYDGRVHPGVLYADNGFWDTYRTVYPLLALLDPERLAEILEGWTQAAREGGWFPTWASPGYRSCMIGTHLDAIIADAYLRGIRGFDSATAYAAMRRDCFEEGDPHGLFGRKGQQAFIEYGYVPADITDHAAARTQEYAYTDFCTARLARELGHTDDFRELWPRAFAYRNTFDPGVGLMRARLRDGSWKEPFDEFAWDTDAYIEGSAWQYSWAVPHDPAGLIALHGGREAFLARLDAMLAAPPEFRAAQYGFEIHEMTEMAAANFGQYAHSNQPVHHVLYMFAAAGAPWKTEHWVRRVLNELYSSDPDGLPGDEDNGEMSAWYVLSALGIFPLCVGDPSFVFGSPLFPRVTVRLPNGRTVQIEAPESTERPYVRQIAWNGTPITRTWIAHQDLAAGGLLHFVMSAEPYERPIDAADLPYSASTELTDIASTKEQFNERTS